MYTTNTSRVTMLFTSNSVVTTLAQTIHHLIRFEVVYGHRHVQVIARSFVPLLSLVLIV